MSVFKRKGSPYYRYDFLFEGRRYQGSTRLTNRIAAQRAEDVLRGRLAERRAGIVEAKPVPVFKDFAPRFLEMVKPEIRPNTHRSYSISVRNLKPWFDPQRLDEITADAIRQFKESRLKEGRAGAHGEPRPCLSAPHSFDCHEDRANPGDAVLGASR